jgi:hypothetical protein
MASSRLSNRDKLAETVKQVKSELGNYLTLARYTRAYGIEEISHTGLDASLVHHPLEADKYIYVPRSSNRNKHLTELRIQSVLSAVKNIEAILEKAPTDLKIFELSDQLTQIRTVIEVNSIQNDLLSKNAKKKHCTHKQAAATPDPFFGKFSLLWKITFFQSRATRAYEKSLVCVDKAANQLSYKLGA